MTKSEAIALLGVSTLTEAAKLMNISQSAVSQWPEKLTENMIVRVHAALYKRAQEVSATRANTEAH